jgi:hypothetical protein
MQTQMLYLILLIKYLSDTKLRGRRKKVDSDPDTRSLLIVADRLHITIQQVLDMPLSHYNLWLAYLKKEQEQYKTKQSLADARNFK